MDNRLIELIGQFKKEKDSLLPILQKVQELEKQLSPESIKEIGHYLDLSENFIYSVASFYPQFRLTAPGEHKINVCLCLACRLKGGNDILRAFEKELGIEAGQRTEDLKFSLERVAISDCSTSGPMVTVDQEIIDNITVDKVREIISKYR